MSQRNKQNRQIRKALNSQAGNIAVRFRIENDILYELLYDAMVKDFILNIAWPVGILYGLFITHCISVILN